MTVPGNTQAQWPAWAASVAMRLEFLADRHRAGRVNREELRAVLAEFGHRLDAPGGGDLVLQRFLRACLTVVSGAAQTHPELALIRDDLEELCALARTAIESDRDDRAVLARARALENRPGAMVWAAACVPGRVVWLAAMAVAVPSEEAAAAAMLVNDLSAVGFDLPPRALRITLEAES